MRLGAFDPRGALVGVEPGAQVLAGVEPVDDPVLACRGGPGAEHLDAEVAGKPAGGSDDSLQELVVEGFVAGFDPAGHGRGDGTVGAVRRRVERLMRVVAQARARSLNWSNPMVLPPGSTNHADRAKPTSATPSTVRRPGLS